MKRNAVTSILISLFFALIGVVIWGVVSYLFDLRLGLVGILIGFLVGKALSKSNTNTSPAMGIIAVIITVVAIILGEYLSIILLVMKEYNVPFFETLTNIDYAIAWELIVESTGAQSLIIYAFSLFEAFKFGSAQGAVKDPELENEIRENSYNSSEDII